MESKIKKAQVVVAVVDNERQSFSFLLLQTNEKRGQFWQNVTGKIEDKETFEEGGLREAIEETQLSVEAIIDIVDLGLTYEFVDQRKRKVHEKCFLVILEKPWEIKIDPHEHKAYKWVKMEDINEDVVKYQSNYETLKKSVHLLRHWGV